MTSPRLQRVLYKRFLAGDRLKLQRKSNTSATGGGARDARFGPWEKFVPIVNAMFPQTETRKTSRKNPRTGERGPHNAVVHIGTLLYDVGGTAVPMQVEMWEPTAARAFEGRLARTYTIPPFRPDRFPIGKGSVFMLLGQDETGMLGGTWITEHALREREGWYRPFQKALLDALDRASTEENLRGFIDLETGQSLHVIGRARG
jgi:hypothetical protein